MEQWWHSFAKRKISIPHSELSVKHILTRWCIRRFPSTRATRQLILTHIYFFWNVSRSFWTRILKNRNKHKIMKAISWTKSQRKSTQHLLDRGRGHVVVILTINFNANHKWDGCSRIYLIKNRIIKIITCRLNSVYRVIL